MVEELVGNLIQMVAHTQASDVHIRTGSAPYLRVAGRISALKGPVMSADMVRDLARLTAGDMPLDTAAHRWEYTHEHVASGVRLRVHAFRERGQLALCLRVIPPRIPTFAELRVPPAAKTLAAVQPGLVLVTGPTGQGKSTTLAAMIQHICTSEPVHVLTVEDPVEFRMQPGNSCVTQREVHRDCPSFRDALVAAMREDPDVLFIGEIRDMDTLEVALHAAESGHAVFSSFHTHGALNAVLRMLAMYPPDEQLAIRMRLAEVLRGVVSQMLVQRRGTAARILATEVLINNYRVKECIRDPARTASIPQVLEKSADQNMHTFDQSLLAMAREGLITPETAVMHATSPNDVRRNLALAGLAA